MSDSHNQMHNERARTGDDRYNAERWVAIAR
jgi:hypothetical protein